MKKFFKRFKYTGITHENLDYQSENVVEVNNLKIGFSDPTNKANISNVIRDVSFDVKKAEVLAIIGESGSGKSVVTSALFGLVGENSVLQGGTIKLFGHEIQDFSQSDWEHSGLRGQVISAVFQNPLTTLNPTMKIKHQIMEGIFNFNPGIKKKEAYSIATDYLKRTRITDPEIVMESYPHQLSGGMKQRVVISAILACNPKIIVLDEPTTALDPTIQAEIIEIVREIVDDMGISIVFITHDLGVVASIADRIAIMYAGQILERGNNREILFNPQHPYTWGLLLSMPDINTSERLMSIRGSVPSNLNKIVGEAFAPRNEFSMGVDFLEEAPITQISDSHFVKSWLNTKEAPQYEPPAIIKERWNKFKKMKGAK